MKLPLGDRKFLFLLCAVVVVLVLEGLSLMGIRMPMPFAPLVFGAFILGVGHEVVRNGLKALVRGRFSNIQLLMLIAVIGAFYLQEYPEAAVLVVLYVLGERLEDIGMENSKSALDTLVSRSPQTAFVKSRQASVRIDQIEVGTIIQVKPGEMIPLDGVITAGNSVVDESAITGEPIPKEKHPGEKVYAGTLNHYGFFEMETSRLLIDTTLSKIVRLTFEAQANKSETQRFIQRFSSYYTPAMIGLAVLLMAIPVGIFQMDFDRWLHQAITLLVIACPCALVISTPVAIYAAIGNASSRGALVKGGKYIEALASVRAIAFDKTRTITSGNPVVSDIHPLSGTSRETLLACTAGAELFSEHPLAHAIVEASRREGIEPHRAEGFASVVGKGITATCLLCDDEDICAGKLDFIKERQTVDKETEAIVAQLASQGKTSVVVSAGDRVKGVIGLMDEIKPDSAAAIRELKDRLGIVPVMLTGDSGNAARYIASQAGIDTVFYGLLPEDKAEKIGDLLHRYEKVAMVGDGINDAPALARSTVGIAMGAAGSDTAIETANIALMNDQLSVLPFLIRLSKKTLSRIKINTAGAIAIKLLFILLAFFGYSHLVFAIAADVGVTLIVILTSLQLMRFESIRDVDSR